MNILLLTANGREHALACIYAKSKKVKKIIMIPGNGLTQGNKIKNYPDVAVEDFENILKICKKERIDFVDVSQDNLLAKGYVDHFIKEGIQTFGPMQKAAQIEWDKAWARDFMNKYGLPIPHFATFSETKKAITYVTDYYDNNPEIPVLFIKATGLAGGKGVIKAETKIQAIDGINAMKQFGASGKIFVIEHALVGKEFSFFALCDGKDYKSIGGALDNKTVYNKGIGPNTGGMGCSSHPTILTRKIIREIEEKIFKPFMKGMQKENRPYEGILYLGGMVTKKGVKIIEFNARWGDPEAEVLLPAIKNDYVDVVMAVVDKKLSKLHIQLDNKKRVSVAGCSFGYPDDYKKSIGKEIFGLPNVLKLKDVTVYGAGIDRKGKQFFANGGRIFHLVAQEKDIRNARRLAYESLSMIYVEGNNLHFRTDIGWQELERELSH